MSQSHTSQCVASPAAEAQSIARLARECSIELNVHDVHQLEASRALLPQGKKLYVSFLPKQTWQQTLDVCRAVHDAGFDPVPHVPVRLLESERMLDELLATAVRQSQVQEVLLIAGDYRAAIGPYASVADLLRSDRLALHGLRGLSLAGHPEGHPHVARPQIRHAECEKSALALQAGFATTLVTQFFFEAPPFLEWTNELRASGVRARLVAGLAGPASIARLFRLAVRCGIGPSIRALGARPTSLTKLIGDHSPDSVMRDLARALHQQPQRFDGIHVFCFGGFQRTCEWICRLSDGDFRIDDSGVFAV